MMVWFPRFASFIALGAVLLNCTHVIAESGVPADKENSCSYGPGTHLVLLGTGGGPVIRANRNQQANLLVVDCTPYLIDAGDGVARQLKKAGFFSYDVQRVFLTHLHFDHTAGIAPLFAFNWVSGRRQPVEIFGPPGTEKVVADGISYFSVSEAIFSPQLPPHPSMRDMVKAHDFQLTGPSVIYQDHNIKVTAVANSHYGELAPERKSYGYDQSFSYRFETPDRVIVFTGDTGPSDATTELARGADILVSEIIDIPAIIAFLERQTNKPQAEILPIVDHMRKEHLAPEEVGKMARAAAVRMVVLSHIVPGADDEDSPQSYISGVAEEFDGPVILGRDLDRF